MDVRCALHGLIKFHYCVSLSKWLRSKFSFHHLVKLIRWVTLLNSTLYHRKDRFKVKRYGKSSYILTLKRVCSWYVKCGRRVDGKVIVIRRYKEIEREKITKEKRNKQRDWIEAVASVKYTRAYEQYKCMIKCHILWKHCISKAISPFANVCNINRAATHDDK